MESSVEEINTVQRRVNVDVLTQTVNQAFDSAYRDIQKRANVKGFRQGKAPITMIKKMYGDSVAADVADQLIKKHLFEAIEKNALRPIAAPALEAVKLPKPDENYKFSAVIDVLPKLELKDYNKLSITVSPKKSAASDLDKELETLRKRNAKTRATPPETKAANGHIVTVTHSATFEDGSNFPAMNVEKRAIELGADQTIADLEKAILGTKTGDDKEVTLTLGDDFGNEALKGKKVNVKLHVDEVSELVLPNLDDEFAKDLGLNSLEDLRSDIKKHLDSMVENANRSEREKAIIDQLIEKNPFDVPPALVNSVINDMINQIRWPKEQDRQRAQGDVKLRESLVTEATRRAKSTLLLWEVANTEQLKVEDQDIDAHLEKMIPAGDGNAEMKEKFLSTMRQQHGDSLKQNLLLEKAMNFLATNAKIKEVAAKN
jgi:trigger factor